jgi:hypothetical protein
VPQQALTSLQQALPVLQQSWTAAQQPAFLSQHLIALAQQAGFEVAAQHALSLAQQASFALQQSACAGFSSEKALPVVNMPRDRTKRPEKNFVNMEFLQCQNFDACQENTDSGEALTPQPISNGKVRN